ncbi:uncharacterized protein [Rhodnius prolixus]|uniref:uncharacterized protein n=1 Tax=Rhodnius prolixus TaxID=13249 RepID=UPI003D18A3BB
MSTRRCTRVVSLKLLPLDSLPAEMMRGRRQYPRMLVYEPIPPVCQPLREPIYSAPGVAMGVTIKVCNYSRMCQACRPPPLCDCKPIAPPLPSGKRLLKKICSLSKLAIFLVAVKWLFDVGIFGDQRKAMKIMKGIKDQMRKFFNTKRACVQSDAAKYEMATMKYNLKSVWNMLVSSFVNTLLSIPIALATVPAMIRPASEPQEPPKKGDKKKPKEQEDKKKAASKEDDKKKAASKKDDKKADASKKDDKKKAASKEDDKKKAASKKDDKKADASKKDDKKADASKKDDKKKAASKEDEKKQKEGLKKKLVNFVQPRRKENEKAAASKKDDKKAAASKKDDKKAEASKKDDKKAAASKKDDKKAAASEKDDKKAAASKKDDKKAEGSKKDDKKAAASEKDDKKAAASKKDDKKAAASEKDDKAKKTPSDAKEEEPEEKEPSICP